MVEDFYQKIDEEVIEAIKNTSDFYKIVSSLLGIHPIDIINSIERLYKRDNINQKEYSELRKSAQKETIENDDSINYLPIPHLIDYDWRFSKRGISTLREKIDIAIKDGTIKTLVFIGSPSLFRYYCNNPRPDIQFYLIDFNANMHFKSVKLRNNFHTVNCNIHYDMPVEYNYSDLNADMVIIDPPWYHNYYERFFEICKKICSTGCIVMGAYPPEMTRSSVVEEKAQLFSYIKRFGFDELRFEKNCIEYSTPPFEKNALKANKILNYPINWRKGDLLLTKRIYRVKDENNNENFIVANGGWSEIKVGFVRIKFKQNIVSENNLFNISLVHLYDNDIYPSVSRRYKGNTDINIWTSGNRVFTCNNVPLLLKIIEYIDDNDIISSLESEYCINITDNQRQSIIKIHTLMNEVIINEKQEYGIWQ